MRLIVFLLLITLCTNAYARQPKVTETETPGVWEVEEYKTVTFADGTVRDDIVSTKYNATAERMNQDKADATNRKAWFLSRADKQDTEIQKCDYILSKMVAQ